MNCLPLKLGKAVQHCCIFTKLWIIMHTDRSSIHTSECSKSHLELLSKDNMNISVFSKDSVSHLTSAMQHSETSVWRNLNLWDFTFKPFTSKSFLYDYCVSKNKSNTPNCDSSSTNFEQLSEYVLPCNPNIFKFGNLSIPPCERLFDLAELCWLHFWRGEMYNTTLRNAKNVVTTKDPTNSPMKQTNLALTSHNNKDRRPPCGK